MSDFISLFNHFHKTTWTEQCMDIDYPATSLDWSNNSHYPNFLITGDTDGNLNTIDVNITTGEMKKVSRSRLCRTRVRSVRMNPLANLSVSTAQTSDCVFLSQHDPSNGRIITENKSTRIKTESPALCAAFMEDLVTEQNLLLLGSRSGISIVDVETGARFRKFDHSGGALNIKCWNGCMFTSTTLDGNLALWDIRQSKPVELYGPKKRYSKQCFYALDASERYIALAECDGFIQINDLHTKKQHQNQKLQEHNIKSLAFSSRYRFLTSTDETSLFIHNLSERISTQQGLRLPYHEISKTSDILDTSWHSSECLFIARGSGLVLRTFRPMLDNEGNSS